MTIESKDKISKAKGKSYTVFIDDIEYHFDHSPITGAELMAAAGISEEVGILLINDDGTQTSIAPDEEIELKPGRRFKKAPHFKRGAK